MFVLVYVPFSKHHLYESIFLPISHKIYIISENGTGSLTNNGFVGVPNIVPCLTHHMYYK